MIYGLDQLKAMDSSLLHAVWLDWQFPFDKARGCNGCITWHHEGARRHCKLHNRLTVEVTRLGPISVRPWYQRKLEVRGWWLREHLEELYALRLFYAECFILEVPKHETHERTDHQDRPSLELGGVSR